MTEELTHKQQKILNFVRKAIEKTGFPPTRIEISKAFRYSRPTPPKSICGCWRGKARSS